MLSIKFIILFINFILQLINMHFYANYSGVFIFFIVITYPFSLRLFQTTILLHIPIRFLVNFHAIIFEIVIEITKDQKKGKRLPQ